MKLFTTVAPNAQFPWAKCGPHSNSTIISFSFSPCPLRVGQNVCSAITGTLSVPIAATNGLSVVGKYIGTSGYPRITLPCPDHSGHDYHLYLGHVQRHDW
ncbi:hypothetical protein BGX21_009143, partial [Mortierella sp. AD011]